MLYLINCKFVLISMFVLLNCTSNLANVLLISTVDLMIPNFKENISVCFLSLYKYVHFYCAIISQILLCHNYTAIYVCSSTLTSFIPHPKCTVFLICIYVNIGWHIAADKDCQSRLCMGGLVIIKVKFEKVMVMVVDESNLSVRLRFILINV